jgi:hypothetical protein
VLLWLQVGVGYTGRIQAQQQILDGSPMPRGGTRRRYTTSVQLPRDITRGAHISLLDLANDRHDTAGEGIGPALNRIAAVRLCRRQLPQLGLR